jgi:hypothetical protein
MTRHQSLSIRYPSRSISTLLIALGAPPLSSRVTRQLHSYGSRFASKLDALVREQMPRLQRWLRKQSAEAAADASASGNDDAAGGAAVDADGMPPYEAIRAAVVPALPHFGVRVADEVFEMLLLGGEQTGRVKVAAAMEGPHLYVSADHQEDYEAVFTELSRCGGGCVRA